MRGPAAMDTKLKYVYRDRSRHGQTRYYFMRRKGAKKIRLVNHPDPSNPAFLAEYEAALAADSRGKPKDPRKAPRKPDTFGWLVEQYLGSAEYLGLEPSTRATRRRLLDGCMREPIQPGADRIYEHMPLSAVVPTAIRTLRDRKRAVPNAANDRLKALKRLYTWAIEEGPEAVKAAVKSDPAHEVKRLRTPKGGHHTWTVEEVRQYEARHPIGTMARLALALYLWTGQRRSDVHRLGRQDIKGGWLRFTQFKNRNRNPVVVEQPVPEELEEIIGATVIGLKTFLVTEFGKAFTAGGLGNKFREWCDEAQLPQCSAHGLRKAAAAIAAENGATDAQLMAYFGWLTAEQAAYYRKQAQRKTLAQSMAPLLKTAAGGDPSFPPAKGGKEK